MRHEPDATPIAMFDSGVGGLTVARALIDVAPSENLVYLGDTARGPYGPRDLSEVREFVFEITDWLVGNGAKLIVVGCNTASAAALEDAQHAYPLPIVGVIEPGVRAALRATTSDRIGLIGTQGTVDAKAYDAALDRMRPGMGLVSVACPDFVDFVERGITSGPEVTEVARSYVKPLIDAQVDTLILGCTHYPLLARVISDAMGPEVTLISSADETAFEVAEICSRTGIGRFVGDGDPTGRHEFYCTADPKSFYELGTRFLGPEVRSVRHIDL